jgi:DNA invertase Pin-like site-specific DNA recombinase
MSDRGQNKRSPDQQFTTIDETITRCGYPWHCVVSYRDDGISGRYLRKRVNFQRMLRDIEAGLIQIDLIVVDTLERLGRADEIADLRRKLYVEYGVLVVAADNGFCDPTGVVGKAVGMVEQIRSTENTRISRHNILRGKKDAARLGRWPGGPPPFGFRLRRVINDAVSPAEVYCVLEIEPRQAAALRLAFERADTTGEGLLRLTKWWNTSPEIPDEFKDISPSTMGYRLENPIAIGTLRWGAYRTGVVNDMRAVEPNPDGAELIPNFCTPLISVELYERVAQIRQLRSEQIRNSRQIKDVDNTASAKLIAPQARGLTLHYLLTGLVRCGSCNASLHPVSSGRQSKAGRRYVYYACPRHNDGSCSNARNVPEDRLREAVIARLRARLFPPPEQLGQIPSWLPELLPMVRQEQQRLLAEEPDQIAAKTEELRQVEQQLSGWLMTLANPQLPQAVRVDIEARYAQSKQRQQELLRSVAGRKALLEHLDRTLDAKTVIAALHHLGEILAGYNPTLGNLELSKHIDVILCYSDGRVEMRGTWLGLFEGAIELLGRREGRAATNPQTSCGYRRVVPRRRGRLRVPDLSAEGKGLTGAADTSLDPERFAGLPPSLFWTALLEIEEYSCWSQRHAAEVARMRKEGRTHEQLAALFHVTVPTIRKALRIAAKTDEGLQLLPRKMPRPRWPEQYFREVAALRRQGLSLAELCQHFDRSDPLIRAALRLADEKCSDGDDQTAAEEVTRPPNLPAS